MSNLQIDSTRGFRISTGITKDGVCCRLSLVVPVYTVQYGGQFHFIS